MSGSLVADLGIGPEVWLFLSLLGCVTLFFKFSRVWSVRNLDLLLLFAVAPGLMMLVGAADPQPWIAFALLFLGSGLWLIRCLIDLGLSRRPLLEPNLNMSGLVCLVVGILGLMLVETVSIPPVEGAARNPADPKTQADTPPPGALDARATVNKVLEQTPLPSALPAGDEKRTHLSLPKQLAAAQFSIIIQQPILRTGLARVSLYRIDGPGQRHRCLGLHLRVDQFRYRG